MSEKISPDITDIFTHSSDFFNQLEDDIKQAQSSVYIQCMSFEADETGSKLIEILLSKPAIERVLLIDSYSKFVVNDVFLPGLGGLLNKNNALTERLALNPLLKRARKGGIKIKFTNPMGLLLWKYPARNHKKLILIDENISYLGGVNFTDHNFEWSDLMVRHIDKDITSSLKTSFINDLIEKKNIPLQQINSTTRLYLLNGIKTKDTYCELLQTIKKASKVVAVSPYICYPMLDVIAEVKNNLVILPANNNKGYINYIHQLRRYKDINYTYTKGKMMHMKLLIVDDDIVIYGSSNFDTISYFFEKEILMEKRDPDLAQKLSTTALNLIN